MMMLSTESDMIVESLTDSNNKKRTREESAQFVPQKPQCIAGKMPNFNLDREFSSDVKFGTGKETNAQRLEMRNKQIMFGKNTIGYDNYLAAVPRNKRGKYAVHPRTPDPTEEVSKRAFDGKIKAWRRELHKWDIMEQTLAIGVNNKQQQAPGVAPYVPKIKKNKNSQMAGDVASTTTNRSDSNTSFKTSVENYQSGHVAGDINSSSDIDPATPSISAQEESNVDAIDRYSKFTTGEEEEEEYVDYGDEDVL